MGRRTRYRGRRTRRAALGPQRQAHRARSHRRFHQLDDVRNRHRAVRTRHPHLGGAARVRPHVGRAGHRDEGAALLRRLRPDAVVDATRRNRVRPQSDPGRRVLRHRRHDVGRRTAARRARPRDVQAEDLEARRGVVRRAGDELRHRPGADLRHRGHLGPAEPASHRGHRPNSLCRKRNQAGRLREVHGRRAGGRRRDPGRRRGAQGRRHPGDRLLRHGGRGAETARHRSGRDQARRPDDDQVRRHRPAAALGHQRQRRREAGAASA